MGHDPIRVAFPTAPPRRSSKSDPATIRLVDLILASAAVAAGLSPIGHYRVADNAVDRLEALGTLIASVLAALMVILALFSGRRNGRREAYWVMPAFIGLMIMLALGSSIPPLAWVAFPVVIALAGLLAAHLRGDLARL